MAYTPADSRYGAMRYNRCGKSGLLLPALSLGLWHNFGGADLFENSRTLALAAFDLGITHFDLANNYGPPPGSAEETLGRILAADLLPHRDELIISTKAGYPMWPGPYGDGGTRKYLVASLDASLRRLGLDYVDIYYHHRPDPRTPLEETAGALDYLVRSGRALYAGISNYPPDTAREAARLLRDLGTPCLIHQIRYNLFERTIEQGLLDVLAREGIGCIAFSPLAQGVLTGRYLKGIPAGSRATKSVFLKPDQITGEKLRRVGALNEVARARGQTLAQMALAWVLRHPGMTSALVGASRVEQLADAVGAIKGPALAAEELRAIDGILEG